jgi:predicted membrane channel-forming protein YqfA (hemolysin III family)
MISVNDPKTSPSKIDLLGAITALVIMIASAYTFLARIFLHTKPGHWSGFVILLTTFPLLYLLVRAPADHRPRLYSIQIGTMLAWLIVLFLLDYVFRYDFRQTQWMVISFVVLYFAGLGGMIGIASLAGKRWTISAVSLFFVDLLLAFVQRAVTGF